MTGSYSTVRLQVSKQVVEMLIAEVSNNGDDTVAVPVREVLRGNCLQMGSGSDEGSYLRLIDFSITQL